MKVILLALCDAFLILIKSVIRKIKSSFFTIDTAKKEDGEYIVIEVGYQAFPIWLM